MSLSQWFFILYNFKIQVLRVSLCSAYPLLASKEINVICLCLYSRVRCNRTTHAVHSHFKCIRGPQVEEIVWCEFDYMLSALGVGNAFVEDLHENVAVSAVEDQ